VDASTVTIFSDCHDCLGGYESVIPCSATIPVLFCHHSHSLFCVSHSYVLSSFYVLLFPFFVLSFSYPLPQSTFPFPFPRTTRMSSRGFEPVTSQAKAKSSYRYTICMFMSVSMIGNTPTTSLTKLTCYPCTMRSSR
jgi:hypothetical protein